MSERACPLCAEEIQAAAILCRHCGNLLVSAELQGIARNWGSYSSKDRDSVWANLSTDEKVQVRATIEHFAVKPPRPAAPAPGQRKTSPIAWGCLILLILAGIAALTPSSSKSRSSSPSSLLPSRREAKVKITVTNCEEEYGFTTTKGLVENTGKVSINFVKLTTQWKDASGKVVDVGFTYAGGSEILRPGEQAMFESSTKHSEAQTCLAQLSDYSVVR